MSYDPLRFSLRAFDLSPMVLVNRGASYTLRKFWTEYLRRALYQFSTRELGDVGRGSRSGWLDIRSRAYVRSPDHYTKQPTVYVALVNRGASYTLCQISQLRTRTCDFAALLYTQER